MKKLTTAMKVFWRDEEGATAIEYGMIVALIAVVIIAAVQVIGDKLEDSFKKIADCLTNPSATTCK